MILVADSIPVFAESLAESLRLGYRLSVFDEYPFNGPSTIEASARLQPTLALVDYFFPDMEGSIVTRQIVSQVPGCKVLLLSSLPGLVHLQAASRAGAAGLFLRHWGLARMAETVLELQGHGNKVSIAPRLGVPGDKDSQKMGNDELERFHSLAPRDIQILALLGEGHSVSEIANRLTLARGTVRNRISNILAITGTRSAREAVTRARVSGYFRS